MKLDIRRETFTAPENHEWLGSAHAADTWESLTLDGAAFLATFPTGIVPSGVVIRRVTASGLFAPFAGGTAGERVFHLATTKDVGTGANNGNTPAAGLWHGQVVVAKLPAGHGLVTASKVPNVDYVGAVAA